MRDATYRKPASAGFSVPIGGLSDETDKLARLYPTDAIVRMKRPDGREYLLRVPGEHLDRLIQLAAEEFGAIVQK